MSLDTVSLSELGTSLVAIEQEIRANQEMIAHYKKLCGDYSTKNEALSELAKTLIKNALPLTLTVGTRSQVFQ
jgi:hypothetical protein